MKNHRQRAILLFTVVLGFTLLLFGGAKINEHKPPIPARVVDAAGTVLFTGEDIIAGQKLYLARGGQHVGSVWGHGSYLAADWSADALHRTALVTAGLIRGLEPSAAAAFTQQDLEALDPGEKARVSALVKQELKQNRYDPSSDTLTLSAGQVASIPALEAQYQKTFIGGDDLQSIPANWLHSKDEVRVVSAFFFWTSWAAVTNRPDATHSYTANFPYDPLAGNEPLASSLIWSIVSVILLILGTGVAIYLWMRNKEGDDEEVNFVPFTEPQPTKSQRATLPYFLVAIILFVVQLALGSVTAHFAVEGNKFYGIDLSQIMPYAATRTWHLQLAVFWIATCWLATGLFIGPAVGGKEPKHQKALVVTLFVALVAVVVGSLFGTWAGVRGKLDNWLVGTQGYEYIELGRVWQVALIGGMILWLVLVARAIKPALKTEGDRGGLTHLLLYASVSIPLFYSMGLFYTPGTHMSVADYWRWWVVHLWVENFFEVFATVALAFVLGRMGAVKPAAALKAVYFSIILYLGAGLVGTFHHLYFTGTPLFITALGATFSALEIVPLTLLGFEVYSTLKLAKERDAAPYKWPLYFFVAVAFWNMVGAGVFGFLINPPIVLYYAQGINTTPIHSHGALFGVYGFLAIALTLFSMRNIVRKAAWSDGLLKISFWGLNAGLAGMMVFSLIPSGFYQFLQAIRHGLWYARSPAVTHSEFIQTVTWLRAIPDTVFGIGALALLAFIVRAIVVDVKLRRAEPAVPVAEPGRRKAA
jgi:nitric oxide reductase subunit B